MTSDEVGIVLDRICVMYSLKFSKYDDERKYYDVWYNALENCDFESIMICLNNYSKESPYPPKIADIYGRYMDGIALIENRIYSGRNLINAVRSRYGCQDEWEDMYEKKIRSLPVLKQYSAAQKIASSLSSSISKRGIDNFSFEEWLGSFEL